MSKDNITLGQRIQNLNTELEIQKRKKEDEAKKIYKALTSISEEELNIIYRIVPEIDIIKNYTVDDLLNNFNGELDMLIFVRDKLQSYIEERLSFYEGCM